MRKNIKIGIFAMLFFFDAAFSAQSQVTIGTLAQPLKGTLLDLKESNVSNGDANSQSGLMLPRVSLTNINSLSPMLSGADLTDAALKPDYTGLIVYNVSTTPPFVKGLYSWDGIKWNLLSSISISAENGLTLSNDVAKLGGNLTQATTVNLNNNNLNFDSSNGGKVGIGVSQPAATLDVAGNVRVANTPSSQNQKDKYLVVDDAGIIRSRTSVITPIGSECGLNGTTDWTNYALEDVKDFYFIDKTHTITLPAMPNPAFAGKLVRFYIYGGSDSKVVLKGVYVPTSWTCNIPGFTYSGSPGTIGNLTISDNNGAIPSARYRFINIISDGKKWFVDNN